MEGDDARPVVIIAQPSAQGLADPFSDFNQQWSVGLCDCCNDVGQCFYAYFCWCCFMGSLAKSINESRIGSCCFPGSALALYRMKVRTTFKIHGSAFRDGCTVCCCPFCVALQMHSELKSRGFS